MTWQQWVLVGFYAFSVLMTVGRIGKPAKTLTPGIAVGTIVLTAGLAALVVTS